MKFKKQFISFALALAVAAPVAAHATQYSFNALNDFSISNGNPNGAWSYAYGTPTSYSLDGFTGTNFGPGYGFSFWASTAASDSLPAVGAGQNPNPHGSVSVPSTELWLHPGPDANHDSIVLFTAPVSGQYQLSSFFTHRDTSNGSGDGELDGVYLNGVLLSNQIVAALYGATFNYNTSIYLNAGDVLAFDVNKIGTYYNDSTGFNAALTVDTTPEPSSLALLGTGVVAIAGTLRRRLAR